MLDAGSLVARLQLDDPSRVQQALPFPGQLPKQKCRPVCGDKLHQLFQSSRTALENVLNGYALPEPYFTKYLNEKVDTLMKCLRDPVLPLLELQV